jgi:hypothetical protein
MDLCVSENEEDEHGVGTGVTPIIMSDVLYGIGLSESVSSSLSFLPRTENSCIEDVPSS